MRDYAVAAGLPNFPVMYNRPGPVRYPEIFARLYGEGLRLVHVDATCSADIYHPELDVWKSPTDFDYASQEADWKRLIEIGPDFRFCLRLYVGSPQWWDDDHPTELQRYADGNVGHAILHTTRTTAPSLASEIWRKDACSSITRMFDWLKRSGWDRYVWGIFPCFGITWEWGILGTDGVPDYSAPMVRRFRSYLADCYSTDASLRESWGDRTASIATAEIPSLTDRMCGDGDLRDFPRDRPSYDYQRCLSVANVELLNAFGETIRAHSGDQYKLGAFYGYTLTAREHSDQMGKMGSGGLLGGHHALALYEDSQLFDFIASPYAYANRRLDNGLLIQHFPLAGAQSRGLYGYDENDLRTFTNAASMNHAVSFGEATTRRDSILHQRLAFAQSICRGSSYWLAEITESRKLGVEISNYSDPRILAEVGRHIRAFDKLGSGRRSSVAEIALVIDEAAVDNVALTSKLFLREVYNQLGEWAWCGAPFDVWLASDVTAESMERYRFVYVFAPAPKPHDRRWRSRDSDSEPLIDTLGRDGRTVWPGPCAGLTSTEIAVKAKAAGVHMYTDAGLHVMAGADLAPGEVAPLPTVRVDFLAVHVNAPGAYAIRLPAGLEPSSLRDVFTGKPLSSQTHDFAELDVALFVRDGVAFPADNYPPA